MKALSCCFLVYPNSVGSRLKHRILKGSLHCFEHVEIMDNFKDALLVDIGEMFS